MSNSIEIPDSDDDFLEESDESIDSKSILDDSSEHTPVKQLKLSLASTSPCTDKTMSTTCETNNANQSKTQTRHRARKSQHAIRDAAESEIQFETLPEDEDEQYTHLSLDNLSKTAIDDILDSEEVDEIVQRIANERVRCNFLLATYQLPDMNFALNTQIDALKLQFLERLRKPKERRKSNETNTAAKTMPNINLTNNKNR